MFTNTAPPALTTQFIPPPACTTDTWMIEYVEGTYYYTTSISNSLEGWYLSQGPTDWSSCFPSGYQATTDFYYSPGVCPSGYYTASSVVVTIGSLSETRATCCPSGYTAQTEDSIVWWSTNRCFSVNTDADYEWTYTKEGAVTSGSDSGGINAKAIFIRWQESDFQTTTTTTTDSTATRIATARSTGSSSGPSATAAVSTHQSSISSKGNSSLAWIAGPVIGAVVVGALIALAIILYNRRQRQKKVATADHSPAMSPIIAELHEESKAFEAPAGSMNPGPFELPELPGHSRISVTSNRV
ncbi:hypothetical protein N7495_004669 [Penicillium taxi]|uniref:uncharacterized protein n=1 Tax=Penicillium taxi TaxID=168475 RepID=UPI00254526FE|nr:uncharacterized protein N7495_004669 [Penicillium taxi]KAJ5899925.1 hypothetical protein N7495_004669 [Penicillium taxi]